MALRDSIIDLLTEFGKKTVTDLQNNLEKKLNEKAASKGSRRSGKSRLSASIKERFPSTTKSIRMQLVMNDYGSFVDEGRGKGNVAESANISKWVQTSGFAEKLRKDLQAKKIGGKSKKKKSLKKMKWETAVKSAEFLVRRKLKREGYDANHFFTEIVKDGRMEELSKKLSELAKREIIIDIKDSLK